MGKNSSCFEDLKSVNITGGKQTYTHKWLLQVSLIGSHMKQWEDRTALGSQGLAWSELDLSKWTPRSLSFNKTRPLKLWFPRPQDLSPPPSPQLLTQPPETLPREPKLYLSGSQGIKVVSRTLCRNEVQSTQLHRVADREKRNLSNKQFYNYESGFIVNHISWYNTNVEKNLHLYYMFLVTQGGELGMWFSLNYNWIFDIIRAW